MEITIKLHDVIEDGFPEPGTRAAFLWDGCIISGWPFIVRDDDEKYENCSSLEEAKNDPLSVVWGGSEDAIGGPFGNVRYWFVVPDKLWRASLRGE